MLRFLLNFSITPLPAKELNDRMTPQRLPYYFGGYWELPNNRVANANGVTRRNPGSGWRTDIYPIE